jgi:hypothetical protein
MNGAILTGVRAEVITADAGGPVNVDLARDRGGSVVDMLSTNLTIDSTEKSSDTAAAAAVIDTANDDLATGDLVRIDVDDGEGADGLIVTMEWSL